jgi:drug/metabolite transporter (DMT)-like permease
MSSPSLPRVAPPAITPSGLVFLAITSVGWGTNFPVMKFILSEWPPLTPRGLTGLAGALGLALLAGAFGQSLKVPRHLWPRLIVISLVTITTWMTFMGLALVWLPASEAAIISISVPVWVSLIAWPVLGERISLVRAVSLAVALGGITVLIGGKGIDASIAKLPGYLFAVAGTVLVASGTILLKRFPMAMPPISLAAWQIAIGCLPVLAFGIWFERPSVAVLSGAGWAALAYMTVVQFCVAYACWFAALARLPASTASIGTLMVPVIGVMSSALMLGEPLGIQAIAVLIVTIGSVAVAMRS